MPITVTFIVDSVADLHSQMQALLGNVTAPAEAPVNEKPKATRTRKAEPAPAATEEAGDTSPSGGTEPAPAEPSTSTTATTSASPSDLDPADVKKRAMAFTQKKGPVALGDAIKEAGVPSGLFKELDGDGLAKLSAFLESEGF